MSGSEASRAPINDPPVKNDSPFGAPLDPSILAEPPGAPPRPFPWRVFAALLLPALGCAAAALWQRYVEGPEAAGDLALRWLLWASIFGGAAGLLAGALLGRGRAGGARVATLLGWLAWGALAPLLITSAIRVSIGAAHPLREALAERAAAECRLTRQVCSLNEFRQLCASGTGAGAVPRLSAKLGEPARRLCDGQGCTLRWRYAGPWTPDNWVPPGSVLCSVVADASGSGLRTALNPGDEAP